LTSVAERLRRKADDYRALGQEHSNQESPERFAYEVLELVLRELAVVVDEVLDELREAA
jgi:hypothetical protein